MQKLVHVNHKALYVIIFILLGFFACSPVPRVVLTPTPSNTVTSMPSPTNTSSLIPTFTPSATYTPRPTLTPLVKDQGQVIFSESFNDPEFPFDVWGPGWIRSGALALERQPGYTSPAGIWPFGGIYGKDPIPPGRTTVFYSKSRMALLSISAIM
jgi:hypothetical protein